MRSLRGDVIDYDTLAMSISDHKYSKEEKPNDNFLHWKDALNIREIPPLCFFSCAELLKLKWRGREVSIRVVACSPWSSHVSVRSKKSTECVQMRSLIKKNLFESDQTFKRAIFTVASVEFFSPVAHLDCFGMDVIFDQFAPWVRLTDCPLFLLRISTKMREVERYILSEYCYYMQWLGEPKKVLAAGGVEGAGVRTTC